MAMTEQSLAQQHEEAIERLTALGVSWLRAHVLGHEQAKKAIHVRQREVEALTRRLERKLRKRRHDEMRPKEASHA